MFNKKLFICLLVGSALFSLTSVFADEVKSNSSGEVLMQKLQKVISAPVPILPEKEKTGRFNLPAEKEVENSSAVASCAVDNALLEELKELVLDIEKAKEVNNTQLVERLEKKMQILKEEINERQTNCLRKLSKAISTKIPLKKSVEKVLPKLEQGEATRVTSQSALFCEKEKDIQKKIQYYKGLIALGQEKLKAKGYASKEEVAKIIKELNEEMAKVHLRCVNPPREVPEQPTAQPMPLIKPIAPSHAKDIVSYYKEKVSDVMSKKMSVDEQIKQLKNLRESIDGMIKELIRSKKTMKYSDIKPLVKRVVITPGKIQADQVTVETPEKKNIEVSISGKDNSISVDKDEVVIGKIKKAKAIAPVRVDNGKVMVGNGEVKVTPEEVIKKVKAGLEANVELNEKNNQPVYSVRDIQPKRIFGIIPIKVRREVEVDATQVGGKILKVKKPWWSFLAF